MRISQHRWLVPAALCHWYVTGWTYRPVRGRAPLARPSIDAYMRHAFKRDGDLLSCTAWHDCYLFEDAWLCGSTARNGNWYIAASSSSVSVLEHVALWTCLREWEDRQRRDAEKIDVWVMGSKTPFISSRIFNRQSRTSHWLLQPSKYNHGCHS